MFALLTDHIAAAAVVMLTDWATALGAGRASGLEEEDGFAPNVLSSSSECYLYYTSGSTGKPKGSVRYVICAVAAHCNSND